MSPEEEEEVQKGSAARAGEYVMETCEPGTIPPYTQSKNGRTHTDRRRVGGCTGDMVLIHGSVLHKSERNTSPNTRFAYTFHLVESEPYAKYDEKNWLQPTKEMPFSRILDEGKVNEF